jgi:uncharacterized protein (TIGR04141 family)
MKLNLYLLRESVRTFEEAIRASYADKIVRIEASPALPFPAEGYALRKGPNTPKWCSFLSGHFSIDIENTTVGFLLLFKAAERVFAATFGLAFHILEPSKLQPDFGIMVCANTLNPGKLKTIDSRNVDLITRQQRTNLSKGQSIDAFGIEADQNWIRFLSGVPLDSEIAKSLAGTDALKLNADISVVQLAEKCEQLIVKFNSEEYKERLTFLDNFRALKVGDPLIERLDLALEQKISDRSSDKVSVALPYFLDETSFEQFKISSPAGREYLEDLTLSGIYRFLDNTPTDQPLSCVKLIALDCNDNPCSRNRELRDHMVAEIEETGETFLLTAGTWFRINRSYAENVRNRIRSITDLTDSLNLEPMAFREKEGDYNKRLAENRAWLCLDKQLFYGTGSEQNQKIEVCDILADEHRFICVKKMNSSATLSHLFSQGAVSAELLRDEPAYRAKVCSLGGAIIRDPTISNPQPCIIFGIATDREGPLADSLFLFSAINLANHARAIIKSQAKVALARIRMG